MLHPDILQVAFLNYLPLISMGYRQKGMLESAIVDFRRMIIQNLEEIMALS
jgi:hypothetical protein